MAAIDTAADGFLDIPAAREQLVRSRAVHWGCDNNIHARLVGYMLPPGATIIRNVDVGPAHGLGQHVECVGFIGMGRDGRDEWIAGEGGERHPAFAPILAAKYARAPGTGVDQVRVAVGEGQSAL